MKNSTPKSRTLLRREDLLVGLEDGSYIVFDIETTGGNPERNGITEICALRYRNGELEDTFYSMVNPRVPIPGIVRRMTGITNKMVRHAPLIQEVMPKLIEFIGSDILVSHNTIGDLKFLVYFAKQTAGHALENFFLCTHLLTEKLLPEAPDKSLQGLGKFLGLAQGPVHRAKEDAHLTLALFAILCERLKAHGVTSIEEAIRLQGDMDSGLRIGWGLSAGLDSTLPQGPGVLRLYDRADREIFLGSSYSLRKSFLALERYHSQPRQLQRVILQSYRLACEPSPHIFAAMLAEAQLNQAALGLRYQPTQWHLRTVPAICLKHEPDGSLRLFVGQLAAGVSRAFGPVHDKRAAQELLERMGSALGAAVSRKGLILAAGCAPLVQAFFHRRLGEELARVKAGRNPLKWLLNSAYRHEHAREKAAISQLMSLRLPTSVSELMLEHGVIVAPREVSGEWDLYPLIGARPGEAVSVAGDVRDWLANTAEGGRFRAELAASVAKFKAEALTGHEAQRVNAALWVIYGGKGKKHHQCIYCPLQDLVNFE